MIMTARKPDHRKSAEPKIALFFFGALWRLLAPIGAKKAPKGAKRRQKRKGLSVMTVMTVDVTKNNLF